MTYLLRTLYAYTRTNKIVRLCSYAVVTSALLTSCTNNLTLNTSLISSIQATSPNEGEGNANTGAFTLTRVIKNSTNPNTLIDLIGDGTGSFGSLCVASGGGGGGNASTAPTVCNCAFSYTTSGRTETIETGVVYHEINLLRCNYSQVPSDVSSMKVSIHLTSADTYSNEVTFKRSNSGTIADTTQASSFAKPTRYQCRDNIVIDYLFDSNVYDPVQSEDPHLTYPIDFYSVNLGGTILKYITASNTNADLRFWNCPSVLDPTTYLQPAAFTDYVSNNKVNLNLYSKAPLGGSKQIYPPSPGIFDRSTFYVAKTATGAFQVPVNAYSAPGVTEVLGFGASPIPIGLGTGQETCPDTSVSIPAGFHWVKVWLFRAGLPQRHFLGAGETPSVANINEIRCNPGDWFQDEAQTVSIPVYPGCYKEAAAGGSATINNDNLSLSMNMVQGEKSSISGVRLADRVLMQGGNRVCVRLQTHTGGVAPPTATIDSMCSAATKPGATCDIVNFDGGDRWVAHTPGATDPTTYGALATAIGCGTTPTSPVFDPMNVCRSGGTGASGPGSAVTPNNINVSTRDLDNPANSRFDFVYVVTPPSISIADMQDNSPTSTSLPYKPYRFFTNDDCHASDPDNPDLTTFPNDCRAGNMITYGLKLHDVASLGDPPPDDPKRPGVFPVCALQPN